eukprot:5434661-Alexandrium_andersonii.AAC.1
MGARLHALLLPLIAHDHQPPAPDFPAWGVACEAPQCPENTSGRPSTSGTRTGPPVAQAPRAPKGVAAARGPGRLRPTLAWAVN